MSSLHPATAKALAPIPAWRWYSGGCTSSAASAAGTGGGGGGAIQPPPALLHDNKNSPFAAPTVATSAAISNQSLGSILNNTAATAGGSVLAGASSTSAPGTSTASVTATNVYRPTPTIGSNQQERLLRQRSSGMASIGSATTGYPMKRTTTTTTTPAPFLTVALFKLHEALPEYCSASLSTLESAAQATAILDSSIANTSLPPSTSNATASLGSPGHRRNSPPSRPGRPLLDWFVSSKTASVTLGASILGQQAATNRSRSFHSLGGSHHSNSRHASPSSSPSRSPSPSSPSLHLSPTTSALALEAKMSTYVGPFICLAAAEVLYADMSHCTEHKKDLSQQKQKEQTNPNHDDLQPPVRQLQRGLLQPSLLGLLYQRIVTDLVLLREILCDPFQTMESEQLTGSSSSSSSSLPPPMEAARNLAKMLDGLITFCTCRAQLVELQSSLFSSDTNNNNIKSKVEGAALVAVLIGCAKESCDLSCSSSSSPPLLYQTLLADCKAWKYCLEVFLFLEQCRFSDTILCLRQWKQLLPAKKETRMEKWFHHTWQHVMSLLPLYFDRIQAFSSPLYGFDVSQLHDINKTSRVPDKLDWNTQILDWLRLQEKGGGPPTCVVMVLDAVQTNNIHVERGAQLISPSEEASAERELGIRIRWPAVYVRSTLHLGSSWLLSSQRLTSSSSHGGSSNRLSGDSQRNLLPGWGKGGSTNQFSNASSNAINSSGSGDSPQISAFRKGTLIPPLVEYDADVFHAEWVHLVHLLNPQAVTNSPLVYQPTSGDFNNQAQTAAITYREKGEDPKAWSARESIEEAASIFTSTSSLTSGGVPSSVLSITGQKEKKLSVFHIAPLSEVLSLAVIVKGVGEARWNRRRSSLSDEEIRLFLTDMAKNLRVDENFSPGSIPQEGKGAKILLDSCYNTTNISENKTDEPTAWNDDQIQDLLKQVKNAFGLRPVSPLHRRDTLRNYSISATLSPMSRSRLRAQQVLSTPGGISGKRKSTSSRRRFRSKPPEIDESATAYFLGADLARLF